MDQISEEIIQMSIDRFWETIPPVWNAVRAKVRSIATHEYDISVEQFHILRHIRKGSRSVSELADDGRISRPAISQAVDVLVNKGLVSRQQSQEDRRYVVLELTPQGTTLLEKIFSQARGWMRERLARLPAEDVNTILSGLGMLKSMFADE